MGIALMGPIELLMILMMGGNVPVVMPPLPADAGMESVAPQDCLFYSSWYGVSSPQAGSGNATEALMAEPQVQQFIHALGSGIESLLTSENAPRDMREGASIFLPLIKDLYQRPVSVYVGSVGVAPTDGPTVDGAIVVHCGDRKESLLGQLQKLEAMFAASTNLQVNEIDRGGVKFRKFMLPPGVPEIGWGISGDYLIFSVGSSTFDDVLQRVNGKRGPPQWLKDIQQNLAVERPGFVQYVNVVKAIETVNLLMPMGGETVRQTMQDLGLNSIRHVATIQGYSEDNVVSKTQIASIGPPHGVLELLGGTPLTLSDLQGIPADSNLAFVLKMDMEAKVNQVISLARAIDPRAAEELEGGQNELRQELGFDVREDLLAPLGEVFRVYNSPESGGLLVTGLTVVADVDDPSRLQATHEKILAMFRQEFSNYGDEVGLSEFDFNGMTIYQLSLGQEAPLAPSWCLTNDRVVFGLYPQSVKAFLSRDSSGKSLSEIAQVQALFAGPDAPYLVSYQDTHDLMRTLYPLVQVFAPVVVNELKREGFDFNVANLPSANAILPHLTPAISSCTVSSNGIVYESRESVPGLSSLPAFVLFGLGFSVSEEKFMELGPQYPQAQNNLKQMAIAMHNYHEVHGRLPAAVNADADGKPLLSWRVHILPYLEQGELYEQFHLDEPWDSEHNKALIELMPEVYKSPGGDKLDQGMTSFLVPTGDDTIFPIGAGGPGKGLFFSSILDGTSNTVMIVEASPEKAVTWTRPEDWPFDADKPMDGLVGHRHGGFLAAFADAHVSFVSESAPAEVIKAIFTRDGGEVVDTTTLDGSDNDYPRDMPAVSPPRAVIDRAIPAGR